MIGIWGSSMEDNLEGARLGIKLGMKSDRKRGLRPYKRGFLLLKAIKKTDKLIEIDR